MSNRKFTSPTIAAIWYKTLIRPILEYCGSIIFTASDYIKKDLMTIENRCLKIISNQDKASIRSEYNIPTIDKRLKYLYLLAFYKLTHKITPIIDPTLLPDKITSVTRLGATGGFLLGTTSVKNSTLNFCAHVFNQLPPQIRGCVLLNDFKRGLRQHLFSLN
jgi:hypothetical protein